LDSRVRIIPKNNVEQEIADLESSSYANASAFKGECEREGGAAICDMSADAAGLGIAASPSIADWPVGLESVIATDGNFGSNVDVMAHGAVSSPVVVSDTGEFAMRSHERSRTGLKIQDGCDNACTYCIVCKARGASVSIPADRVLRRAIEITREGHREIVLSGINLGAYDAHGLDLAGLLHELLDVTEPICARDAFDAYPARFRISSIEPPNVTPPLLDLLAGTDGRVCRHLHIPLQSGSARVLAEMARNYSADEYLSLIEYIRARVPQIAISTDIIVGFPGETDADFAQTMEMARVCGFSKIHVFPYSRREGTPAAARKDQIDSQVKKARARALAALGRDLRAADLAARVGSSELFCIQENGRMTSESYYELDAPTDLVSNPEIIGKLIELNF
jgi:MiaB/RimO family radical SAM methylthiotransferase